MTIALENLRAALAGRYRIERELGAGGMATVYLAHDLKHGRDVAVKVLRPELGAELGAERFLAEIRISARLDHPHILTLIDSGNADGLLYYVLPFVRGESLRDRLNREQRLGIEDALAITRQVAGALDYAHRQHVIHRDIKPENILIQEGEAMLADFGIALAVKEAGGPRLTETGVSLGTPHYMSPEQAAGERTLDARSDIYSLAAMLYEMLAGEPPITGPTIQSVIAKLLTERPIGLRVVRDTVSLGLEAAVAKALAKTPADRFASMAEFAAALRAPPDPGAEHRARAADAETQVLSSSHRTLPAAEHRAPAAVAETGSSRLRRARRPAIIGLVTVAAAALVMYFVPAISRFLGPRSLMSQGLLTEGDQIVLASFESPSDPDLADVVTEAIRVSLGGSTAFTLMDPTEVRATLSRMTREPAMRLTEEVAREVAIREGRKVVIGGSVARTGSRLLLLASVHAADGRTLVSFREAANSDEALIDAIDRLAGALRTGIGESIGSVKKSEPLRQVTTASLPALRSYTGGVRAYEEGNAVRSVELLRDAIALDTGFAMAYRQLGVSMTSSRATQTERDEVGKKAFELRDRLTPKERYQAEAYYYDRISGDVPAEMRTYEQILELDPNEANTLNMKGRALAQHFGDFQGAGRAMEDAIRADPRSFPPYSNLVWVRIFAGDEAGARAIQARFDADFPATFWRHRGPFILGYHYRDPVRAHAAADTLSRHPAAPDRWTSRAVFYMSLADASAGRLDEARDHLARSVRSALERRLPHLALSRQSDRIWMEALVANDTARARAAADSVLTSGWLDASVPRDRPYFMLVRDAARAGAVRVATQLLERWKRDTPTLGKLYEYDGDYAAATALLGAARGEKTKALFELQELERSTGPRFVVEEWPSERHCQRCFVFDIARLHESMGAVDSAIASYRRVLDTTNDLIETPLDRIIAWERLGMLYERAGDRTAAADAYRNFASYWKDGDPALKARATAARARADSLQPRPGG
ncbi:MAG: protein kinase [Gemmatimonadota bacterium]|nr:protein kinase [Gemmatimonadota bacterium]